MRPIKLTLMELEAVARACHEANRAYCDGIGERGQVPWEQAPDWQRLSVLKGVEALLTGEPGATSPAVSHERWRRHKLREGWVRGATKDAALKMHPNLVPYDALPESQKAKDRLFVLIGCEMATALRKARSEAKKAAS